IWLRNFFHCILHAPRNIFSSLYSLRDVTQIRNNSTHFFTFMVYFIPVHTAKHTSINPVLNGKDSIFPRTVLRELCRNPYHRGYFVLPAISMTALTGQLISNLLCQHGVCFIKNFFAVLDHLGHW